MVLGIFICRREKKEKIRMKNQEGRKNEERRERLVKEK
jgi:hypothetical protein